MLDNAILTKTKAIIKSSSTYTTPEDQSVHTCSTCTSISGHSSYPWGKQRYSTRPQKEGPHNSNLPNERISRTKSLAVNIFQKIYKNTRTHLLLHSGGLSGGGELRRLQPLSPLLLQALVSLVLADLHHIVFSLPPRLIGIHGQLVPFLPHLHTSIRSERHLATPSSHDPPPQSRKPPQCHSHSETCETILLNMKGKTASLFLKSPTPLLLAVNMQKLQRREEDELQQVQALAMAFVLLKGS